MATRRRVRRRSIKGGILDIKRRLRYIEAKPNPFKISNKAINRDAIQFNAVSSDQIAPNAVGTEEIADDSITNNLLADNSVSNDNLQNGSVGNTELQDNSVTESKLANNSVSTDKIQGRAVTGGKIAQDAIGGRGSGSLRHILAGSINTGDIQDLAIGPGKLATDAVTTVKINNLAVTTIKLAAGAVTTSKIADSQVTVAKLSFQPIVLLNAGEGIAVDRSAISARVSARIGTASNQVARGSHGHIGSLSFSNQLTGTAAPNSHRHGYTSATSVSITSTKKLKKDIQNYNFDINVILKLQLKKFKYLNQARNKMLNREWEFGYIAEEVEELGFEEILGYNAKGEPNSINYSVLSVFAIELLKQQQKQIDFLTKEIEKLKENK